MAVAADQSAKHGRARDRHCCRPPRASCASPDISGLLSYLRRYADESKRTKSIKIEPNISGSIFICVLFYAACSMASGRMCRGSRKVSAKVTAASDIS